MASRKQIQDLIGKSMADAEFGASLLADPAKTAKSLGYDLTEEQVAGFKASDLSQAEGLDERLSKMIRRR
jgi:hypothetical protein